MGKVRSAIYVIVQKLRKILISLLNNLTAMYLISVFSFLWRTGRISNTWHIWRIHEIFSLGKSRRRVGVTNVLPSCSNVGKIEALRWRRGLPSCGKHFLLSYPINITPKMQKSQTNVTSVIIQIIWGPIWKRTFGEKSFKNTQWRKVRPSCGKHFLLSFPINITPRPASGNLLRFEIEFFYNFVGFKAKKSVFSVLKYHQLTLNP